METQVAYYTDKINSNVLWENAGVVADSAPRRNVKEHIAFKKLLAECCTEKVDLILTKPISRFGQNTLDAINVLREFFNRGVDKQVT